MAASNDNVDGGVVGGHVPQDNFDTLSPDAKKDRFVNACKKGETMKDSSPL